MQIRDYYDYQDLLIGIPHEIEPMPNHGELLRTIIVNEEFAASF